MLLPIANAYQAVPCGDDKGANVSVPAVASGIPESA